MRLVPGPIRLLTLGVLINRTGGFVVVFLALILAERGFAVWQIGIALALVGGFGIAGAAVGGAAAVRLGSRWTIIYSTGGCAVLTALLAIPSSFGVFVTILCGISLLNRAYMPASASIVGRLSPPGQQVPMFAFYQLTVNVGAAGGALIAGFVLARSLTVLLLIDAATTGLFTAAALYLPHDRPDRADADGRDRPRQRGVLRDRRYLLLCVAFGLIALVYGQRSGVLPLALTAHHFSVELIGELLSANAIAVVLLELPLSMVIRFWPSWLPLCCGAALICGGYAIYLAGVTLPTILIGVSLWTLGEMFVTPVSSATAMTMAPNGSEGAYQGALQMVRTVGLTAGPAMGVFAYTGGRSIPWWGCAVAGVMVVAIIVSVLRGQHPATDQSSAQVQHQAAASDGEQP
jgi:predicted MFS family arabinose efflux permease